MLGETKQKPVRHHTQVKIQYLVLFFIICRKVSIKLPRSAVLWTLLIQINLVSIELPYMAVLWTLLTNNRKVSIELLRSAVLQGFWLRQPKSVHKTAIYGSFVGLKICVHRTAIYGSSVAPNMKMGSDNRKVSIELLRSAVLWVQGSDNRKVSIKLPYMAVLLG